MSSRFDSPLPALACAVLGALAIGCEGFTHLEFQPQTSPPPSTIISYRGIEIPEGRATAVFAIPMDGDDPMDEDTFVELVSDDRSVLGVDRTLDEGAFVIYGAGAGSTRVRVYIDGEPEGDILATVKVQQPQAGSFGED